MLNTGNSIEQKVQINPIFARHETFHPRFGWLKKGFDKVGENASLFKNDDASVILGVGKNMVKSIKYWCIAYKIIENKGTLPGEFQPTSFALNLFSNNGWDPFLEDPASLWLLHWQLLRPPCDVPVWYLAFNEFNQIEFTVDDLILASKEFKTRLFPNKRLSDLSISKDVNCLLRMYVERDTARQLKEDSLDSPFVQLRLINTLNATKRFVFNFDNKSSLPPEIIVWACLDYSSKTNNDAKTISLSRLLFEAGSPGQAFKITEAPLCDAIEKVSKSFKDIALTETAGMIQFAFKSRPDKLAENLLKRYYKKQ